MAFQKMEPTPTPTRSLAEARSLCVPVENIYITLSFLQCKRERGRERGRAVVCVRAWMVANDSEECRKVGCLRCHCHPHRRSFTLHSQSLPPAAVADFMANQPTTYRATVRELIPTITNAKDGHKFRRWRGRGDYNRVQIRRLAVGLYLALSSFPDNFAIVSSQLFPRGKSTAVITHGSRDWFHHA